jgi:hypothetical protein
MVVAGELGFLIVILFAFTVALLAKVTSHARPSGVLSCAKLGNQRIMNTQRWVLEIIRPLAIALAIFGAAGAMGGAQVPNPCATAWNGFDPGYNSVDAWLSAWDTGAYDRNHILLGTVDGFAPNRLKMTVFQGDSLTVDLKEGTVIRPTGSTPTAGQRVAVFGYWSNGTFIANRIILHG